ncbi:hypothetical protein [Pedobacter ginsengiterrae]|uniref:DoxX family protein n=1 Tax=Pedobacter ginsengiterrae TaxID=871696 RepID=UPI0031E0F4B0
MKPLIVLLVATLIFIVINLLWMSDPLYPWSARFGMLVMLCFTALGHFLFPKGMSMMLPDFVPFKKQIIYLTAGIELILGLLLVYPPTTKTGAILLIVFFIAVLPSNIHAARKNLNYEKGTLDGPGLNYLWFRIPEQIFFILWVFWCGLAAIG